MPGGILAIWFYPITHALNKKIDTLLQAFYRETVGPYWAPERRYVDEYYALIAIPFGEIGVSVFTQEKHWTLNDFVAYLGTWSSVQKYKEQHGEDPVASFVDKKLLSAWGDPNTEKTFLFEFHLRIVRLK